MQGANTWKNVNPIFDNNVKGNRIVTLVEGSPVIINGGELAKICNEYFVNIVPGLVIFPFLENNDKSL